MEYDQDLRPPTVVVFATNVINPRIGGAKGRQTPPMSPLSFAAGVASPYSRSSPASKRRGPPHPESIYMDDVRGMRSRNFSPQLQVPRLPPSSDAPFDEIVSEQALKTPPRASPSRSMIRRAQHYDCPDDEVHSTLVPAVMMSTLEDVNKLKAANDSVPNGTILHRNEEVAAVTESILHERLPCDGQIVDFTYPHNVTPDSKSDMPKGPSPSAIIDESRLAANAELVLTETRKRQEYPSVMLVRKGYDDDMAIVTGFSEKRCLWRLDPPGRVQRRYPSKSVERRYEDPATLSKRPSHHGSLLEIRRETLDTSPQEDISCDHQERRNDEPITPPGTPFQDDGGTRSSFMRLRTESDCDETGFNPSSSPGRSQTENESASVPIDAHRHNPTPIADPQFESNVGQAENSHFGTNECDKVITFTPEDVVVVRTEQREEKNRNSCKATDDGVFVPTLEYGESRKDNLMLAGVLPGDETLEKGVQNTHTGKLAFTSSGLSLNKTEHDIYEVGGEPLVIAGSDAGEKANGKSELKRRGKLAIGFLPIQIDRVKTSYTESVFGKTQNYGTRSDQPTTEVTVHEDPFEIALEDAAKLASAGMRTLNIVGRHFEDLVLGSPSSTAEDFDSASPGLGDDLESKLRKIEKKHATSRSGQGGRWWVEKELAKLANASKTKTIVAAQLNVTDGINDEQNKESADDVKLIDDSAIFVLNDLGQVQNHYKNDAPELTRESALAQPRGRSFEPFNKKFSNFSKDSTKTAIVRGGTSQQSLRERETDNSHDHSKGINPFYSEGEGRVRFQLPSLSSGLSTTVPETIVVATPPDKIIASVAVRPDSEDEIMDKELYPALKFFLSKPGTDDDGLLGNQEVSAEDYALDGMLNECEDFLLIGLMGDEQMMDPVLAKCDDCMFGTIDAFDSDDEGNLMCELEPFDEDIAESSNIELFVSERVCLDFSGDEKDADPSLVGFQASMNGLTVANVRRTSKSRKSVKSNFKANEQFCCEYEKRCSRQMEASDGDSALASARKTVLKNATEGHEDDLATDSKSKESLEKPPSCSTVLRRQPERAAASISQEAGRIESVENDDSAFSDVPLANATPTECLSMAEKVQLKQSILIVSPEMPVVSPVCETEEVEKCSPETDFESESKINDPSGLFTLVVSGTKVEISELTELQGEEASLQGLKVDNDVLLSTSVAELSVKEPDNPVLPPTSELKPNSNGGSNVVEATTEAGLEIEPEELLGKSEENALAQVPLLESVLISEAPPPTEKGVAKDQSKSKLAVEEAAEVGSSTQESELPDISDVEASGSRTMLGYATISHDSPPSLISGAVVAEANGAHLQNQTSSRNVEKTDANELMDFLPTSASCPLAKTDGMTLVLESARPKDGNEYNIENSPQSDYFGDYVTSNFKDGQNAADSCNDSATVMSGSSEMTEIQSNITPILVKTLDDHLGIAKGDIMISLLGGTVLQVTVQAQWAGRVQEAIWRSRTFRRNCDGQGRDAFSELRTTKRRSSLPIDVDDACVAGGIRSIGKTEEAVMEHLKVSSGNGSVTDGVPWLIPFWYYDRMMKWNKLLNSMKASSLPTTHTSTAP